MKEQKPIYKFDSLKKFLQSNGIQVGPTKTYQAIVHELTVQEMRENIVFTDEGVRFTDEHGQEWDGYLYKKNFAFYGTNMPKYHLCQCDAIQTWGRESYIFANTVDIECFNTSAHRSQKVHNPQLCGFCKNILRRRGVPVWPDADSLIKAVKSGMTEEPDLFSSQVNVLGNTDNWEEVKQRYLEKVNYTCENCGVHIDSPLDHRYLECIHLDGHRENNLSRNLKCLCPTCRAKQDSSLLRNKSFEFMLRTFEGKYKMDSIRSSITLR